MATTKTIDLTEAGEEIADVRNYVQKTFGFFPHRVTPSWTQPDPSDGCAFCVGDVCYQVEKGKLSITSQIEE